MMKETRKLFHVILIALVASLTLAPAGQAAYNHNMKITVDHTRVAVSPPAGYGYVKGITIDNTKVSGTSDLTDFPVLVSIQNDAALKTTANGGRVTDPEGDDLVFFASDLSTRLDYEVEQYDGAMGTLVAWVRLPVLEFDVDTVFYLAYGNGSVSSPLADGTGVWDGNYSGVWHLKEATDATNIDSTSNANDGTPQNSPAAATGKISGALNFEGATQTSVDVGTAGSLDLSQSASWTISAWVKPSTNYVDSEYPILYTYGNYEAALDISVAEGPEDGRIEYYLRDKTALYSDTALNINAWNHVVAVQGPDTTYFYLNGVGDGAVNNVSIRQDNNGSYIGGYPGYTDGDMLGLIDEVRISNTVRSADWIATEYNNQNNPGGFMTIEDKDSSPLVDFPVLVSIQNDAQLKTTANGGQVTDAEGDDIIFTADVDGVSPLDHEVESYDGTTGSLVAWVRLPTLAVSEDTVFFLHYGDSAIDTSQEDGPGVWDDNYKGVWHLKEEQAGKDIPDVYKDSTSNSYCSDGVEATGQDGQINGGQEFSGASNDVIVCSGPLSASSISISAWVKHDTLPNRVERYVHVFDGVAVIQHYWDKTLSFYIKTNSTLKHINVADALEVGPWYHVVGTWDGTTQRLYLDGNQIDSQVPGGSLDSPDHLRISAWSEAMDGFIDEVRVSNTARSADWIKTEYNNQQWPNKAQWPAAGFITVQRAVCDITTSATPVTCGSTTAGSIETPGAWDAFEVSLGADTWLDIYTTGTTDTYGHLYDGNCDEIAQDDTVDYNFFISTTVAAGTYYVQVRHASEFETGDYELSVECKDDDHGDNIDDATTLDCNSSIGGNIGSGGDEDYFKVVFWGTGILTAYTTDGSDPNGTLLDGAGNIIAADDDSGGGKDFKIVQTVGPGVYYVVVREKNSAQTGAYTLHLDCKYTPVITATSEYGGTISPAGAVGVAYDAAQSFTITPAAGNTVRDVWVDGAWVGAVNTYEFQNVQKDHKIVAVFNADFENCVDIPDIPLDAWYRSAPANVMFVLDDSGSMDWEFMTTDADGLFDNYYRYVFDDAGDNLYGRVLPDDRRLEWKSQWADYNTLYYDPAVTYQPWPNHEDTAAETLDAADPDTPRSHPMDDSTTFDLNKTYVQYTDDTAASTIIINDQDSEFSKTPEAAGEGTLLSTGFEGAKKAWDDEGFENNGPTKWKEDKNQDHSGKQSAKADKNKGGNLTSDDLDAGDLVEANGDSITVDFWFKIEKIEKDDEFTLHGYNGSTYVEIDDLISIGQDQKWVHYQKTITAALYFRSDFRIRLVAEFESKKGKVWVDDVLITKNAGGAGWALATGFDEAYNGDDPDKPGEYWWTAADGDYTATWTPDIPVKGDYEVYAHWVADENHSKTVPYTVNYDKGGSDTVEVNQRLNGGKWVLLGTYPFEKGTGGNVSITYTRGGNDDRVCADAVKFAPAGAIASIDIKRAHYYVWSESVAKPYLVVLDGDITYYAVTDTNSNDKIDEGELTTVASPPADVQPGRNYIAERQNFANWYQFYRRRELAATGAVANVIAGLKGVHVGFYSINGNLVQPAVPVRTDGIDKTKKLLQSLYGLKLRSQGTPLRRGLREVGKYFADSSKMIGKSPYASIDNGGACQQAFTIMMTDGFWNGSSPAAGNADGDDNTAYDGGGHADIYADTLADVAMKYYENDLHTGLDDEVPAHPLDPATHQHMVTYAVSFGRVGSLDPDDYDLANGVYPDWPDPRFVGEHKIDDLWHAAVNGRGEFVSAASPTELVNSLLAITRSIQSRIASSSSVSVNGDPLYKQLDDDTLMYQATYRTDSWLGDVSAYKGDSPGRDLPDFPD